MGKIFVNYRRDDSRADSRQIVEILRKSFGPKNIFFDVASLDKGSRFDLAIDQAVARCDAMVVVIGEQWLSLQNDEGKQRLFEEEDFIRYEIERALHRNKPILPLLLDGTPMPKVEELPPSLRELALWNGAPVAHETFTNDVEQAAQRLKAMTESKGIKPWWVAVAAAAALVIGLGGGYGAKSYLDQSDTTDKMDKLRLQISGLQDQLNQRQTELINLQRTSNDRKDAVDALTEEKVVLEADLREVSTDLEDAQAETKAFKDQLDEALIKLGNATTRIEQLENSNGSQVTELSEKLRTAGDLIRKLESLNSKAEKSLQRAEERLSTMTDRSRSYEAAMAEQQAQINALRSRSSELTELRDALQAKLKQTELELEKTKRERDAARARMQAQQAQIADIKDRTPDAGVVGSLNAKLQAQEKDIEELKAAYTAVNSVQRTVCGHVKKLVRNAAYRNVLRASAKACGL